MAQVTKIPARTSVAGSSPQNSPTKRRVAGYARVSTDRDEQLTSYESQLDYYEKLIKSHSDWEFVGMYSDEGISGTSTAHRDGFKKMVDDALAGKIDLIITKSVSRFARNTVDSLTTIRNLKDKNVEVYFEKENIRTFDGKGEVLLTIMSSLAQEESRSISQNVTWGTRKRFADGKASVAYSLFLGYDKGENGEWVVNEEQAKTVREIFRLFLSGKSYLKIAQTLTEEGHSTPAGKSKWASGTVKRILTNEKYKGDALLQKSYTENFLTKKLKKNEGEVPQYYVKDHHQAIVDRETFDLAQAEIEKRSRKGRYNGTSIFSSKIICSECGGYYSPKVWHSNDQYRKVVWQCSNKYAKKGHPACHTPHLSEEQIKQKFVAAMNDFLLNKKETLNDMEIARQVVADTGDLERQQADLEERMEVLSEQMDRAVSQNARVAQNQTEFRENYDSMVKQYNDLSNKVDDVQKKIQSKRSRALTLDKLIKETKSLGAAIDEFDAGMWGVFVEKTEVGKDGLMTFTMKDGTTIRE